MGLPQPTATPRYSVAPDQSIQPSPVAAALRACSAPGTNGAALSRTRSTDSQEYVASSNPATRLDWPNSTLLSGDIPAAVADLKRSFGSNLVIMGSGVLIGALMATN